MDRTYYAVVPVPAGTAQATPVSVPVTLEDAILKGVECVVPDGHCGLTGIRLLQSQQQIFPWANNSYLVANDEKIPIAYDDQIQSSGITAQGFNTDIFDHSFYLRFTITDLPLPGTEPSSSESAPIGIQSSFIPEPDAFNIDNILAETSVTPDFADVSGEPPPPVEPTLPLPVSIEPPTVGPVRKPKPIRKKAGRR